MAEFFILKAYRRKGGGQAALAAILGNHPGAWHIGVPLANLPAQGFWRTALAALAPDVEDIAFEGDAWRLNTFTA